MGPWESDRYISSNSNGSGSGSGSHLSGPTPTVASGIASEMLRLRVPGMPNGECQAGLETGWGWALTWSPHGWHARARPRAPFKPQPWATLGSQSMSKIPNYSWAGTCSCYVATTFTLWEKAARISYFVLGLKLAFCCHISSLSFCLFPAKIQI